MPLRGRAQLYQPTALVSSVRRRRRTQAAKASYQRPPPQSHRALQVDPWCIGHAALALLSLAPGMGPNGGHLLCRQLGIDALISRQAVLEARPDCKALSPATSSCCVARLAGWVVCCSKFIHLQSSGMLQCSLLGLYRHTPELCS